MANEQNLKPMNQRSESEVREMGKKGGVASGKSRRAKKRRYETFKEMGDVFLSLPLKGGKLDNIESISDLKSANITAEEAMFFALLQKAMKGDIKAIEAMVELTGKRGTTNDNPKDDESNSFIEALEGKASEAWDDAE